MNSFNTHNAPPKQARISPMLKTRKLKHSMVRFECDIHIICLLLLPCFMEEGTRKLQFRCKKQQAKVVKCASGTGG